MDIIKALAEKQIFLNQQQKAAILDDSKHLLLLAVPGSGKTTVMVSRIARLIGEKQTAADAILTMTFSREAAKDMAGRFRALFPELPPPRFSTIHSFCNQVLRQYAACYHRTMPLNIETEQAPVKKAVLLRTIYNRLHQDFIGDDALETLGSEISYIKNKMIPLRELGKHPFETHDIGSIFQEYESCKKQNNWMDFDDMLSLSLDIFQKRPAILRYYQEHLQHINVDEAQDTSLLQHKIIAALAGNKANLFMVGDEDQSIYSFRGACPEALLNFSQTYPDAKILKSEENFRSSYEIVEKSNIFIRQNRSRYEKSMFCQNRENDCIYDIELSDYQAQYGQVLRLIEELPPKESVAVLYRNNESALPLIDLFEKKGISFYIKEHRASFFSSFVVRDILSYFRLSQNPRDLEAFRNIYFKLYLSKKVYQYVESHLTEYDNIFDLVLALPILTDSIAVRVKDLRDRLPKLWEMRPLRAIQYIEDRLGYSDYIASLNGHGFAVESLNQKLNILKSVAAGYDTIPAFADRLDQLEQQTTLNRNKNESRITLSTIHSVKGLEFDHVILIDMLEGVFPSADAIQEKSSGNRLPYEEEVRLFYVAATRAKKRLYLLESNRINACKAYPSRFLYQLLGEEAPQETQMTGKKIFHSTYKYGVILNFEEDTVTAEFELFGTRSFCYSYCLENGIILVQ